MTTILTRMGDGYAVEMTPEEVREDLAAGSADAAKKGKIPVLEPDEFDYLFDMFANPIRVWGVERGHEAVLTKDGSTNSLYSAQLSSGVGLPLGREQAFRVFERAFHPEPKQRYPTTSEFVKNLQNAWEIVKPRPLRTDNSAAFTLR